MDTLDTLDGDSTVVVFAIDNCRSVLYDCRIHNRQMSKCTIHVCSCMYVRACVLVYVGLGWVGVGFCFVTFIYCSSSSFCMANIYLRRRWYDRLIRLDLEPKLVVEVLVRSYLGGEVSGEVLGLIRCVDGGLPGEIVELVRLRVQHEYEREQGII